jgi:L-methionine (R)-S-oxide reductase
LSDSITIDPSLPKEEKYKSLLPQIESLVEGEDNMTANLGNICSALKYNMDKFFWVGFYLRKGDELNLGPFQGPVACTRIKIPSGVCGTVVKVKRTIIVDDVSKFPGHIACSSESKSEIVVPIFKDDEVIAVLDIDSDYYSSFDETDKTYLEKIVRLASQIIISGK